MIVNNQQEGMHIGGVRVVIDRHMREGEFWVVNQGKSTVLHVHEGPKQGEDVEVWLRKPRVVRYINLG